MAASVRERLTEMAKTIRLPGFRAGKIPMTVLEQRYGSRARSAVQGDFAARASHELLKRGGLASALDVVSDADSMDFELKLAVTWLPDLPDPMIGDLVRLTTTGDSDASRLLEEHFRTQILDQLDAGYPFTIAPVLIQQEVAAIGKSAAGDLEAVAAEDREEVAAELRIIAERRVRLGAVLAERGAAF
jgi:FKBP-type peptidyl-prolyl cis-trans isomerase (trigger factor)